MIRNSESNPIFQLAHTFCTVPRSIGSSIYDDTYTPSLRLPLQPCLPLCIAKRAYFIYYTLKEHRHVTSHNALLNRMLNSQHRPVHRKRQVTTPTHQPLSEFQWWTRNAHTTLRIKVDHGQAWFRNLETQPVRQDTDPVAAQTWRPSYTMPKYCPQTNRTKNYDRCARSNASECRDPSSCPKDNERTFTTYYIRRGHKAVELFLEKCTAGTDRVRALEKDRVGVESLHWHNYARILITREMDGDIIHPIVPLRT